jgi:hypothetical protein
VNDSIQSVNASPNFENLNRRFRRFAKKVKTIGNRRLRHPDPGKIRAKCRSAFFLFRHPCVRCPVFRELIPSFLRTRIKLFRH